MLDEKSYLLQLKTFEGCLPHMYLDTAGNVTVAVGKMLANVADALKLGFVRRGALQATGSVAPSLANPDDIEAEFLNLQKQVPGKIASYYRRFTKLELPEHVIDSLLRSEVAEFTAGLTARFPEFDSYPCEACAALLDMAYNLGLGKLISQYPRLCSAVVHRDWTTAARECRRSGISEARNQWTKEQFEKAGAIAPSVIASAP